MSESLTSARLPIWQVPGEQNTEQSQLGLGTNENELSHHRHHKWEEALGVPGTTCMSIQKWLGIAPTAVDCTCGRSRSHSFTPVLLTKTRLKYGRTSTRLNDYAPSSKCTSCTTGNHVKTCLAKLAGPDCSRRRARSSHQKFIAVLTIDLSAARLSTSSSPRVQSNTEGMKDASSSTIYCGSLRTNSTRPLHSTDRKLGIF